MWGGLEVGHGGLDVVEGGGEGRGGGEGGVLLELLREAGAGIEDLDALGDRPGEGVQPPLLLSGGEGPGGATRAC